MEEVTGLSHITASVRGYSDGSLWHLRAFPGCLWILALLSIPGNFSCRSADVLELYKLAHRLMLDTLIQQCRQLIIASSFAPDDLLEVMSFADFYQDDLLMGALLPYFSEKYADIVNHHSDKLFGFASRQPTFFQFLCSTEAGPTCLEFN